MNEKEIETYLEQHLRGKPLECFQMYKDLQQQKRNNNIEGMRTKAQQGKVMSRAPFGYKVENKQLVFDEVLKNEVYEIFRSFMQGTSLNQIAKKHSLTVNGVKKVLKNYAYIGKVRFDGMIHQGTHESLIDIKLFNDVQKRFEDIKQEKSTVMQTTTVQTAQ